MRRSAAACDSVRNTLATWQARLTVVGVLLMGRGLPSSSVC